MQHEKPNLVSSVRVSPHSKPRLAAGPLVPARCQTQASQHITVCLGAVLRRKQSLCVVGWFGRRLLNHVAQVSTIPDLEDEYSQHQVVHSTLSCIVQKKSILVKPEDDQLQNAD